MTRRPHHTSLIYAENKAQYRLLAADTSTPTHETIWHPQPPSHHPRVPTKFGTVHQHRHDPALPARKPPQRLLARLFDTSHPTISRAISSIITALNQAQAEPPKPADLGPRLYGVVDAPSCRAIPGPISQNSTTGSIKPPGIFYRSSMIKAATLCSSPSHMLVVCTISRRSATPGC